MSVMVKTERLTKDFGTLRAVRDLNLSLYKGEVLGLLGPNGAGKTATVRMLAGIIAPTCGYAWVAGIRTSKDPERLHQHIGLLTETPGFYERLSASYNLEFFARFYPQIDAPAQAAKYLDYMGLSERARDKVGNFSKGMKQRLALARALVHEPGILFLDEPTAGLDPQAAREVRKLIKKLKGKGRAILLCTHNLDEAEELCERIAVINTELIALDTPENLRERLFGRQVIAELSGIDARILEVVGKLSFVKNVSRDEDKLIIQLADFEGNRPALIEAIVKAGGRIQGFYPASHSLEEIYFTLMQGEKDVR